MEFFDVLARRHSIRRYLPKKVEEEKINLILEAVNTCPTAGNLQAYHVVVVRDEERRRRLARACYNQEFVYEAPVSMVFLADPMRSARRYGRRGMVLYSIQDATIAATYAMLSATALDLGTCWVGAFDDDKVREVVGASSDLVPVAVITIGYPAERPEITERRKISEMANMEVFGRPFPHKEVKKELIRS
ncbi:MAG: nitroreductase [Thermoproteota archaeon]|nr:MAG: nitroreductase [Candidatus Korarchaeota archaeon]